MSKREKTIEEIYRIIIAENLNRYIKGSDKYNKYNHREHGGNCFCLIRDYYEIIKEMENKKWLKIISNTEKNRAILLYPKFIIDNKKFIIKNFYELGEDELIAATFELKVKKKIYNKIKNYKIDEINKNEKVKELNNNISDTLTENRVLVKKILFYIGRSNRDNDYGAGDLYISRFWSNKLYYLIEDFFITILNYNFVELISDEINTINEFLIIRQKNIDSLNYLVGNGFSIGLDRDYMNNEIILRIIKDKNINKLLNYLKEKLLELFNSLTPSEIIYLFRRYKTEKYNHKEIDYNKIKNREFVHLIYAYYKEYEKKESIDIRDICIEDYFYIFSLLMDEDRKKITSLIKQEIKLKNEIILSILNENKALSALNTNEIKNNKYKTSNIKRFFEKGNIFTTNYDMNIESIIERNCFHIHGGFDVWYKEINNSEIILRNRDIKDGLQLLSKKYKPDIILDISDHKEWMVNRLELIGIDRSKFILDKLKSINGLVIMFGFSGYNDRHINNNIKFNMAIKDIIYIYYKEEGALSEKEKFRICEEFSLYDRNFYFVNANIIWDYFKTNGEN